MKEVRRVILECLLVTVIATGVGFVANALSSRGLKLTHNYFPKSPFVAVPATQPTPVTTAPATQSTPTTQAAASQVPQNAGPTPESLAIGRLQQLGVGVATREDVKAMLADPMYGQMLLLIDARDDEHYQKGHIPGAYQFFHYYADRYWKTIEPLVYPAQKIIVYCNGGDCEDSEHAAMELMNRAVDKSKISVYLTGWTDWTSAKEPIEKGDRGSGAVAAP